ncbi:Hypothetical protein conserved in the Yarrowia clade [Yarrowia lipolytica]|nr:Hypothetical protein conserved in the Yarrowia clade [Yarrowia lipolytica]
MIADHMRISIDKNTLCPGDTLAGTIMIDKQICGSANNFTLGDHLLGMQFHGVERTVKASRVLICQRMYPRLIKETSTTREYCFEHRLQKNILPTVTFHDHKIVYQVALRFESTSQCPPLVCKMPIIIMAPVKDGEISNNIYNVVVPELVVDTKSNFNIKAVNPRFSNITSVEYQLIDQEGKAVYKNHMKLKGWNPEVDPSIYIHHVAAGKYLMKLNVKDLRTTSKFDVPVLVHQQDFLPAYTV